MEIREKNKPNKVMFRDLDDGETFKTDAGSFNYSEYYLKVSDVDFTSNCVALGEGRCGWHDEDVLVERVSAYLTVEP